MHCNRPLPGFVEELFVVPVRVRRFEQVSAEVVISKPDDTPRQQKGVFIAAGISDL